GPGVRVPQGPVGAARGVRRPSRARPCRSPARRAHVDRVPDLRARQRRARLVRLRPGAARLRALHQLEGRAGQAQAPAGGHGVLRGRGLPHLLVEPPGTGVPGRAGPPLLNTTAPSPHQLATDRLVVVPLAVAGAAMALASRGDLVVVAVLLAVLGAQAALGPAGWTGRTAAVASAWLAATALVLAVRDRRDALEAFAVAAAFAVTAADVAVGAAPGGALAARIAASVVAFGAAVAVARLTRRRSFAGAASWLCLVAGVAALVCGALR